MSPAVVAMTKVLDQVKGELLRRIKERRAKKQAKGNEAMEPEASKDAADEEEA